MLNAKLPFLPFCKLSLCLPCVQVFLLSLFKGSKLLSMKLKDVQVVDIHHHIKELSVCTDIEKIFCCVTKCCVLWHMQVAVSAQNLFLCVINDFCLHCMYSSTTRQCTARGSSFPEDISSQWSVFLVIIQLFCSILVGVCEYLLLLCRFPLYPSPF